MGKRTLKKQNKKDNKLNEFIKTGGHKGTLIGFDIVLKMAWGVKK